MRDVTEMADDRTLLSGPRCVVSFSYPSAEVIPPNKRSACAATCMLSSVTLREAPASVRTVWGINLDAFVSGLA